MKAIKSINFKNMIIYMKFLYNKELLVVDNNSVVRCLNQETLTTQHAFKANAHYDDYREQNISFSSDFKYFALLSENLKELKLINIQTKKVLKKFARHQGEISHVQIDPLNRYLFSCGDDGQIFAINLKNSKLAFTLPKHKDRVNDLVFNTNATLCASASYDKNILLFNISTMRQRHLLKSHSQAVMKVLFLDNQRLLSIDKKSSAIVWDVTTGKIIARIKGIHDDVTDLCVSDDGKFLFVSTVLGYIIVYELQKYTLIHSKFIKLSSAITKVKFNSEENHLIVATKDGDILIYDIYALKDELRVLLQEKRYAEIEKMVEENPFLSYTHVYKRLNNIWEETLLKAENSLEYGDDKRAKELFSNFKEIPSKNTIIQTLLSEYKNFGKFVHCVKENKYVLAYSLANMHQTYKKSKTYKALELKWRKAFLIAQKYMLEPKGLDKAKEILFPYKGVPEKNILIQLLMNEHIIYERFKISLSKYDYKVALEYVKLHPFLKEFPEYKALMQFGDDIYIKSQKLMNQGDTHSAIKMLVTLKSFDDYKDEVDELIEAVKVDEKFFNAIEAKNYKIAYNLLDSYTRLADTQDGKKLQEQWDEDFEEANNYAININLASMKSVLKQYLEIPSKYLSIATIFANFHLKELEYAFIHKKEQSIIENGIKKYLLLFGLDYQIEHFFDIYMGRYKDSNMELENLKKGVFHTWRPSMIVDSIIDK